MPFGSKDERRFFVSEACKSARTRNSVWARLCVEYSYEDFKRMVGRDGFGFCYGTTIMGICVSETKVAEYLMLEFLQKHALEKALADADLRCWWFCDADFEGMTMWHKDMSESDMLKRLKSGMAGEAH